MPDDLTIHVPLQGKDTGTGTLRNIEVGGETGDFGVAKTGAAKESSIGTDGSAPPALPGGATGLRGWLRAIYERLGGTLTVGLPAGASTASGVSEVKAATEALAPLLDGVELLLSSIEIDTTSLDAKAADLTLTRRMLAKSPAAGHRLWVDTAAVTNVGAGVIMAEAPAGSLESAASWRGVLIPSAGGQWVERTTLFRWDQRLAGW